MSASSSVPAGVPADPVAENPCQSCGACCAAFRVLFYWTEAQDRQLSDQLVERVNPHTLCMRGTWQPAPRCVALAGEIGRQVRCTVYPQRPSPCQTVRAGDQQCQRARARYGLPRLVMATMEPAAEQVFIAVSTDSANDD